MRCFQSCLFFISAPCRCHPRLIIFSLPLFTQDPRVYFTQVYPFQFVTRVNFIAAVVYLRPELPQWRALQLGRTRRTLQETDGPSSSMIHLSAHVML